MKSFYIKLFIVIFFFSISYFAPSHLLAQEDEFKDLETHYSYYMLLNTNLILNLDASNLDNMGTSASTSTNNTTWIDLSESLSNATLNNFFMTQTSFWDGNNTTTNPSTLKFDGIDDNITLSTFPSLNPQAGFTYSLWLKTNTVRGGSIAGFTGDYIFDRTLDTPSIVSLKEVSGNQFGFQVRYDDGSGRGGPVGGTIFPGKWQNITLVRNYNNTFNLYVDGVLVSTTKDNGKSLTPPLLKIGSHVSSINSNFNGQVASFRIYKAALSQEQISENYLSEAYKFQGPDNITPGVKLDTTNFYKKTGDPIDVYIEDANPFLNGDNSTSAISSLSCILDNQPLTSPTITEQVYKSGLTFDGIDDTVIISDSASLRNLNQVTLEALVKPATNTGNQVVIQKGETGIGETYLLDIDATKWRFGIRNSSLNLFSVSSISEAIPNKWTHIACTYDGSNLKIYINGIQENTLPIGIQMLSQSTIGLGIGNSPELFSGLGFNGSVAQARIYNRALSKEEIDRNNRYRFEAFDYHGLIGYWKFDDFQLNNASSVIANSKKWDNITGALVQDINLNGTLTNFNFTNESGWISTNQYLYNTNKYTFAVPNTSKTKQFSKIQCTAIDKANNSTKTNEEEGEVYLLADPNIKTNLTNNQNLAIGDKFTISITDDTPDKNILTNNTIPTATINGNIFSQTCTISPNTFSKSLSFNGINNYVEISETPTLSFQKEDFSLTAWIRPENISKGWLFTNTGNSSNSFFGFGFSDNRFKGLLKDKDGNTIEISSNTTPTIDTWYHAVITREGTTAKIYLNGILETSISNNLFDNLDLSGGTNANIGRHTTLNEYFSGEIEDLQVYTRALNSDEINRLYNSPGRPINPFKLASWWRFNEPNIIMHDYSGNENNGTLKGYPDITSSLINSNLANSIDGSTGSCNVYITDTNPTGPGIQKNKDLTVSIPNNTSTGSSETKQISISRNTKPLPPTISTVTINGTNSDNKTGAYNINVGNTLVLNFISADPDSEDSITLSTSTPTSIGIISGVKASNPGSLTYSFTPSLANSNMTYNFTVRATDSYGTTAATELPITIKVSPNTPPLTPIITSATINSNNAGTNGTYILNIGDKLAINLTATDNDPYNIISLTTPIAPKAGTFIQEASKQLATGAFTYTPTTNDIGMIFNFTVRALSNNTTSSSSDLSILIVVAGANLTTAVIQDPQTPQTQIPPQPTIQEPPPINNQSSSTNTQTGIQTQEPQTTQPQSTTPINFNNLPLIQNAEFPKIPGSIVSFSEPTLTTESIDSTVLVKNKRPIKVSNTILTDSPIAFALSVDSEFSKNLLSILPRGVITKVKIIDSAGKEFDINAEISLSPVRNKPLIIQTSLVPINVSEGKAILVLLINNEPKARIIVDIYKSQFLRSDDKGIASLRPIINSAIVYKNSKFLKLIVGGENFFNKEIFVNGKTITTKTRQTLVSALPKEGLRLNKVKILKGEKVIVIKYKISHLKRITGRILLSIINPYGQALVPIEIPTNKKK